MARKMTYEGPRLVVDKLESAQPTRLEGKSDVKPILTRGVKVALALLAIGGMLLIGGGLFMTRESMPRGIVCSLVGIYLLYLTYAVPTGRTRWLDTLEKGNSSGDHADKQ